MGTVEVVVRTVGGTVGAVEGTVEAVEHIVEGAAGGIVGDVAVKTLTTAQTAEVTCPLNQASCLLLARRVRQSPASRTRR